VASVVNLVRSQVYHTERPPLFAAHCRAAHLPLRSASGGSSTTAEVFLSEKKYNSLVCYYTILLVFCMSVIVLFKCLLTVASFTKPTHTLTCRPTIASVVSSDSAILMTFAPHNCLYCELHSAHCYRRSSVLCRSVCWSVCLPATTVIPAKTTEPIEMPFGMWTGVGQ